VQLRGKGAPERTGRMKCERCGWCGPDTDPGLMRMQLPAGMPTPPPLPRFQSHPAVCRSGISVGEEVFWDLGPEVGQFPPIRARFLAITEFTSPEFVLGGDGKWVMVREPCPSGAVIRVAAETVLPEHRKLLGRMPKDQEDWITDFERLSPASSWPVLRPSDV
jgi:hypothetical protein